MFSDIQLREVFHFCFLHRLLKISDINLYVLKGGVNLRFFFGSPRYSEDMDLDVVAGNVGTLKKNGYKILKDAAFLRSLKVLGSTPSRSTIRPKRNIRKPRNASAAHSSAAPVCTYPQK